MGEGASFNCAHTGLCDEHFAFKRVAGSAVDRGTFDGYIGLIKNAMRCEVFGSRDRKEGVAI